LEKHPRRRTFALFANQCVICGWHEATCDIHHIVPIPKGSKCVDILEKVILLCPNCHRLATVGKFTPEYLFAKRAAAITASREAKAS